MRRGTCDRAAACGSPLHAWRRTLGSPLSLMRSRAWVELGCPSPTFSPCRLWFCSFSAVGVWGGVGLLRAWVRGRPPRPRHRAYLLVGCVALASFTLALGL